MRFGLPVRDSPVLQQHFEGSVRPTVETSTAVRYLPGGMSTLPASRVEVRRVAAFSVVTEGDDRGGRRCSQLSLLAPALRDCIQVAHLAHLELGSSYTFSVSYGDVAQQRWMPDDGSIGVSVLVCDPFTTASVCQHRSKKQFRSFLYSLFGDVRMSGSCRSSRGEGSGSAKDFNLLSISGIHTCYALKRKSSALAAMQ